MISDLLDSKGPPESMLVCNLVWEDFIERVRVLETQDRPIHDEQVWTVLCAYGYSLVEGGPELLARVIFGDGERARAEQTWLEFMPASPRREEGPTHLDLAFGDLKRRNGTEGGICHEAPLGRAGWSGFVEAKWLSDISYGVGKDPKRNQLLRVIENALSFQSESNSYPAQVHVALLTPGTFKRDPQTRFYGLKYGDYVADKSAVLRDLAVMRLEKSRQPGWKYPADLAGRLGALSLHWATFEEVLGAMPSTPFKAELTGLAVRPGSILEVT